MCHPAVRFSVWLLAFAAAFVLTHTPPSDQPSPVWWLNDKILHTIGYTILGFLTVWVIGQARVGDRWRTSALSLAGLLVYAAFDEMTQPLVGRTCEFSDWLADAGGAAIGTLAGVRWQLRRKTE